MHAGLGSAVDEQLIEPVPWHEQPGAGITGRQRRRERPSPGDVDTDLVSRSNSKCSNVIEKAGPLQQPDAMHVEAVAARLGPVPRPALDQRGAPAEPGKRASGATACRTATDHDRVKVVRNTGSAGGTDHGWSVVSCQVAVMG